MNHDLTWRRPRSSPKERSGRTVAILSFATLGIYYAYWVHRLHQESPGREGTDRSDRWAVPLPVTLGVASIVPVVLSGALEGGEVDLQLFGAGMAVNFLAHAIYLWTTLRLTDRLAGLAEAAGFDTDSLRQGKLEILIGILAIAVDNIGLKSASLLKLDLPEWIFDIDKLLLGIGAATVWRWSQNCLVIANDYAQRRSRVERALSLPHIFMTTEAREALGVAPSRLPPSQRQALELIRRAQWMIDSESDSGLEWFLESEQELLTHGVVVPGKMVQANSKLFKEGDDAHPGELVFSLAEGASPHELKALASRLFDLKGKATANAEEAFFSEYLRDEMERVQGVRIPKSVSSIPETFASTTLFYREHLPQGRVGSGVYPVLVSPETLVAMVLPMDLWTQAGYDLYLKTGGHPMDE